MDADFSFVSTPADVAANIERYAAALRGSKELRRRARYHQSWYGVQRQDGTWAFGPSKFVGYENLDANEYVETSVERNGRTTEVHLRKWFNVVEAADPMRLELVGALRTWLATFGLVPRAKIRINVRLEQGQHAPSKPASAEPTANDDLVDLLIRVSQRLSGPEVARLRAAI